MQSDLEKKFEELQQLLSKDYAVSNQIATQMGKFEKKHSLAVCDASNIRDVLFAATRLAIEEGLTPVLILTTINYRAAQKMLMGAHIEQKCIILDTISKNIIAIEDTDRVVFIDSLRNITQLQIKLINVLTKQKNVCVICDSLDVFGLYYDDATILKLVSKLTIILHKYLAPAFFIANRKDLADGLTQLFDGVIDLPKS